MKPIADNKEYTIEFKYITGEDMIKQVRQLFLEYGSITENRPFFSKLPIRD